MACVRQSAEFRQTECKQEDVKDKFRQGSACQQEGVEDCKPRELRAGLCRLSLIFHAWDVLGLLTNLLTLLAAFSFLRLTSYW